MTSLWETLTMKTRTAFASLLLPFLALSEVDAQEKPTIPEDLVDEAQIREDIGLNDYTVPSIVKVFDELEKISPLSYSSEHLTHHERLPLDRTRLAMRLGTLIADGFMAVQTGHPDDVPKIASHLSRYAKALGAGNRIKRHAAALLEHAENKDLQKLKVALAATQRDVERELIGLRDPDLSTLISLGGWLQALEAASTAVAEKFTIERSVRLFREDIADYYTEMIGALDSSISQLPHMVKMRELLSGLRSAMTLLPEQKPKLADVQEIQKVAAQLATFARK